MVLTSSQRLSRSPGVSQSGMISTVAMASCSHMMSLLKRGLHSLRVSGASKSLLLSPVQVTLVRHVGSRSHAWLLLSKTQPPGQAMLKAFPSIRNQAWPGSPAWISSVLGPALVYPLKSESRIIGFFLSRRSPGSLLKLPHLPSSQICRPLNQEFAFLETFYLNKHSLPDHFRHLVY